VFRIFVTQWDVILACVILRIRSVLEANHMYLAFLRESAPEQLAKSGPGLPDIVGNVRIHKTAVVHPTAKVVSYSACVAKRVCRQLKWCCIVLLAT
jgi:hypothetical protein